MDVEAMSTNQRISFLLKDTTIYGLSIALSKATSLILLPIISYNLSPQDYGIIDFFQVITQSLALLVVFGIESAVARYFYELENHNEKVELISQSFFLQLLFIVVYFTLMVVFDNWIMQLEVATSKKNILFSIIIFQVPFISILNFCISILKWTFSRKNFLILSIGLTLLNFVLIVILSFLSELSIVNFFLVGLITYFLFSIIGVFLIRKWLIIPRSFKWPKTLLSYSFPLLILSLLNMSLPLIERLFIFNSIGAYEMGLFAISAKMGIIIMTFITAFQTSWGPFSLSLYKNKTSIHIYNLVLKTFTICIFLIITISIWIIPYIIKVFFADGYTTNRILLFIILMGIGINGVGMILQLGISISNRTKFSLYSYVFSVIVGFMIMKFALDFYGIKGVALGTLAGIICRSSLNYYFAQKLYPMDWDFYPIIRIILLIFILNIISLYLNLYHVVFINLFYLITVSLIAFFGWKFVYNKQEKLKIITWVKYKYKSAIDL